MIEMTADIDRLQRELAYIRYRSVPFAIKAATDEAGRLFAGRNGAVQREWNRVFNVRRKNFPGGILRVRKAFVDRARGRISKPTRVVNIDKGSFEDILNDQLRGRRRRPKGSRAFVVPVRTARGRKIRKGPRRYRAGKYLFERRSRGPNIYVGVLADSVKIPKRFTLTKPLARIRRIMPRLLRKHLRRELAAARARQGR